MKRTSRKRKTPGARLWSCGVWGDLGNQQRDWCGWNLGDKEQRSGEKVCMHAKSLQSRLCNRMDHIVPGSSVHGILQARVLEWVALPPPGDLPNPGIEPMSVSFLHW